MKILSSAWQAWKKIAHKIGVFQARLILTLFYFLILSPAGLLYTLFKDELKIKKTFKTSWIDKNKQSQTLADLRQQY